MSEWNELIQQNAHILEQMERLDIERIWEYYPPNKPIPKSKIIELENKLGLTLSSEYKEFLLCANGWQCFYQMVDLFGTEDFVSEKMSEAKSRLEIERVYDNSYCYKNLLPIAVSRDDRDLFVIILDSCQKFGQIIWYAGGVIEIFESFKTFFITMMGYNEQELKRICAN